MLMAQNGDLDTDDPQAGGSGYWLVLTHLGLGHERVHALLMAALYTYGPFDHASDKEQWQLETHL